MDRVAAGRGCQAPRPWAKNSHAICASTQSVQARTCAQVMVPPTISAFRWSGSCRGQSEAQRGAQRVEKSSSGGKCFHARLHMHGALPYCQVGSWLLTPGGAARTPRGRARTGSACKTASWARAPARKEISARSARVHTCEQWLRNPATMSHTFRTRHPVTAQEPTTVITHHDDRHSVPVVLRASRTAHHLRYKSVWNTVTPAACPSACDTLPTPEQPRGAITYNLVHKLTWMRCDWDMDAKGTWMRMGRGCEWGTHLQDVRDGEVHVAPCGCVIELGALDDHQMRGGVDAPCKGACCHQDLCVR